MTEGPAGWARPLHTAVLDAADVVAGTTLLDLGCGTGEFARAAARRAAPGSSGVTSTRPRWRSATAAVPEARCASVGDAQDLGPVDALGGPFAVVAAVQLLDARGQPAEGAARGGAGGGTGRDGRDDRVGPRRRVRRAAVRRGARAVAAGAAPPPGPPALTDPDRLRQAGLAGRAGGRRDRRGDVHVRLPRRRRRSSTRCWRRGSGGRRRGWRAGDAVDKARCGSGSRRTGRRGAATGWRTCSGCWWPALRDACAGGGRRDVAKAAFGALQRTRRRFRYMCCRRTGAIFTAGIASRPCEW